jgi:putative redox protein
MANVTQKSIVTQKLSAQAAHHARTDVTVRDLTVVIDEPEARGGTNKGATPTETLMVALSGCINVVSHRIADAIGLKIDDLSIDVAAQFDRRGVMMEEAVKVPFPQVDVDIHLKTSGSDELVARLQADLKKYCPLSMVIRQSGTQLNENWHVTKT